MSRTNEVPVTMDDVLDDEADLYRIMRARSVGRVLRRVGWYTAAAGLVSLAFTIYFVITGDVTGDEAVKVITGTILGTLLTGITAYGSGSGLTLAASNLARRMEQSAASAPKPATPAATPATDSPLKRSPDA